MVSVCITNLAPLKKSRNIFIVPINVYNITLISIKGDIQKRVETHFFQHFYNETHSKQNKFLRQLDFIFLSLSFFNILILLDLDNFTRDRVSLLNKVLLSVNERKINLITRYIIS